MVIFTRLSRFVLIAILPAIAFGAAPAPVVPVTTSPASPAITRPWPSGTAALGQTIEIDGIRITPIKVLQDRRMGCVPPPGELPQRLCVAHGWLDLRLRVEAQGRSRTITLREMTPMPVGKNARLGFVARPDRPTGNPADYSFEFIVWPKDAKGPFGR